MTNDICTMLRAFGGKGRPDAPDCWGKAFREAAEQYNDMEHILEVRKKADKPMRVKDICKAIPKFVSKWTDLYGEKHEEVCYQLCTHRLRLMRRAGLVERTEVADKEHSVEVEDYNWRTHQYEKRTIEPVHAYYSAI